MKYTTEILTEAVRNNFSVQGVMRELGLRMAGGTHAHISKKIKDLGLDTSHFKRQAHNKGQVSPRRKTPESLLILGSESDPRTRRSQLLRAMTEMGVPYKCVECSQDPEWNGKPLCLDIDHVNGDFWDNRLENLRFLCPNCHSQQEDTNKPRKYRT